MGTVGVAAVAFALTIAPARADGGGVLTVDRRQRRVSGVGLFALGTLFVAVAFVWTAGEALLTRFDVVD